MRGRSCAATLCPSAQSPLYHLPGRAGYPWFNWWTSTFDITSNERIEELFALNAPMIGTDDLQPIFDAAKEAGVNVVLPITERDNQGAWHGQGASAGAA